MRSTNGRDKGNGYQRKNGWKVVEKKQVWEERRKIPNHDGATLDSTGGRKERKEKESN